MNKVTENFQIRLFAEKIKEEFKPQKIILFGSYAYGKPMEGSDIDFLIIMNTDLKPFKQSAIIRQTIDESFGVHFPMDIIVRTPGQIEERIKEGDFFIKKIISEGIVL